MAEEIWLIGPEDGLQFELALEAGQKKGLAWGTGRVYLQGETVWSGEDKAGNDFPLRWTWLDMLEFLGRNWPWLILEESYPIPVTPLYPGVLRREAERRWEDLPEDIIEAEDEAVYRFLCRHDLAMALKGLFVPSLILLRQGQQYVLSCASPQLNVIRPYDEIARTLTELGDHLARFVQGSAEPRAGQALDLWQRRNERLRDKVVALRSGLDPQLRGQLVDGQSDLQYWELDPEQLEADTEILAAARMSAGVVGVDIQREILQRLRRVKRLSTPTLDALSARLTEEFSETGRPFKQGYWLAGWLRSELKLVADEPVEPSELLADWGVAIETLLLPDCVLDAIAAWGQRHGPVILVNKARNTRASHEHGERSTLAHEICHLLMDRQRSLPVAEVLGGRAPEYAEKRARAFAAELLLPREVAAAKVSEATDLPTAIERMQREYRVSKELIMWQIKNSSFFASLSPAEQSMLNQLDHFVE